MSVLKNKSFNNISKNFFFTNLSPVILIIIFKMITRIIYPKYANIYIIAEPNPITVFLSLNAILYIC